VGHGLLIHEVSISHTKRRTRFGRTSLDEWSARRTDLYLTTHNTHNKYLCPRWDSKPQSQQASGLRPRGHWDWLTLQTSHHKFHWNYKHCTEMLSAEPFPYFIINACSVQQGQRIQWGGYKLKLSAGDTTGLYTNLWELRLWLPSLGR